jgi:hypothetical protein
MLEASWFTASVVRMDPDHASRQPTELALQIQLRVYSVEILLMMDSEPVRNT